MSKKQSINIGIVFTISIVLLFTFYIISLNNTATPETNNITEQMETGISEDQTEELTPPPQGYHVTIVNVSESISWQYPQNSTLEDLVNMGYDSINVSSQTLEDYPYIKEGLKPGAKFTMFLEDEDKEDFFEQFYGKCFSYGGHNYVINAYRN